MIAIDDPLDREPLSRRTGGPDRLRLRRVWIDPVRALLAGPEAGVTLLAGFLAPAEREVLAGFRLAKRRAEWLAGRLAAKEAARALLAAGPDLEASALGVLADEHGRPRLVTDAFPASRLPAVSISHSAGQAVALASWSPCGVDIQKITPQLVRVRDRFASPAEQELIAPAITGVGNDEARSLVGLGLLWAAKEALRKVHGILPLPGFHEYELVGLTGAPAQPVDLRFQARPATGETGHLVQALVLDGYAVAWTIRPKLDRGEPVP